MHLLNVFNKNGYSKHRCLKAFLKAEKGPRIKKDLNDRFSGVHLLFIQGTTDRISRIMKKHKVPLTFKLLKTIRSSLRSVKDHVNPKDGKDVYVIPCSCGTLYIDEIGRSINQMIHEHAIDIKHGRSHSFALVEHAKKTKHHICTEEDRVIAIIDHFHHRKFMKALEIERRPINLNIDNG